MKPFTVKFDIDTAILLNNHLHLDALLGKIVTDRGGTIDDIPLKRRDGVWQGSAAMLETGVVGASRVNVPRLKGFPIVVAETRLLDRLPVADRRIGPMSDYRSIADTKPGWQAVHAVWFVGCGDPERARDLLRVVKHLGHRHKVGYGAVINFEVETIDGDVDTAGLVLANGQPARAIPLDIWRRWGHTDHPLAVNTMTRAQPPNYEGEPVLCTISPQQTLMAPSTALQAMIHA